MVLCVLATVPLSLIVNQLSSAAPFHHVATVAWVVLSITSVACLLLALWAFHLRRASRRPTDAYLSRLASS